MYHRSGNFRVANIFDRNQEKILIDSMFPGSVIWNETMYIKKTWSINSLMSCGYDQPAVGKLLTCEREPMNSLGTYCGSKDRRFIGH